MTSKLCAVIGLSMMLSVLGAWNVSPRERILQKRPLDSLLICPYNLPALCGPNDSSCCQNCCIKNSKYELHVRYCIDHLCQSGPTGVTEAPPDYCPFIKPAHCSHNQTCCRRCCKDFNNNQFDFLNCARHACRDGPAVSKCSFRYPEFCRNRMHCCDKCCDTHAFGHFLDFRGCVEYKCN